MTDRQNDPAGDLIRRAYDADPGDTTVNLSESLADIKRRAAQPRWEIDEAQPDRATLEAEAAGWAAAEAGGIFAVRATRVAAIQWTGNNWPKVKAFLLEHVVDAAPSNWRENPAIAGTYNRQADLVWFYARGEFREVAPGRWIVVHLHGDLGNRYGEIMYTEDFLARFEPAITR